MPAARRVFTRRSLAQLFQLFADVAEKGFVMKREDTSFGSLGSDLISDVHKMTVDALAIVGFQRRAALTFNDIHAISELVNHPGQFAIFRL